jgi:hypothetical protein
MFSNNILLFVHFYVSNPIPSTPPPPKVGRLLCGKRSFPPLSPTGEPPKPCIWVYKALVLSKTRPFPPFPVAGINTFMKAKYVEDAREVGNYDAQPRPPVLAAAKLAGSSVCKLAWKSTFRILVASKRVPLLTMWSCILDKFRTQATRSGPWWCREMKTCSSWWIASFVSISIRIMPPFSSVRTSGPPGL